MSAPQQGDRVLVTDVFGVEWPAVAVEEVSVSRGKGGGWPKIGVRVDPSARYPDADTQVMPWPLDSVRKAETARHHEGDGPSGPSYSPGRGYDEPT